MLDAIIDHFADAVGHMAERLGSELDNIEDTVMGDEPPDHRPRIGRVRLQAVRVHRQLALLRGMFHRLEPRVAAQHPAVAQAMRTLAQKLDAIDQEVGSLQERARLLLEEVAARMTEITNRRLFTLSILDRLPAAADFGHRLLRHEHQGPAVAEQRGRHLDRDRPVGGLQRGELLGAAADARVLSGHAQDAAQHAAQRNAATLIRGRSTF